MYGLTPLFFFQYDEEDEKSESILNVCHNRRFAYFAYRHITSITYRHGGFGIIKIIVNGLYSYPLL